MTNIEGSSKNTPRLPNSIGGEVYMYCFFQVAANQPLPNPDDETDISDVMKMIGLHTAWSAEQLDLFRPAIVECVRSLIPYPEFEI